jgi:hypothetical protein
MVMMTTTTTMMVMVMMVMMTNRVASAQSVEHLVPHFFSNTLDDHRVTLPKAIQAGAAPLRSAAARGANPGKSFEVDKHQLTGDP